MTLVAVIFTFAALLINRTLSKKTDPKLIPTARIPTAIFLEGRWLTWHTRYDSYEPFYHSWYKFSVYDLVDEQLFEFEKPDGRIVGLTGDTLYVITQDENDPPNTQTPRFILYGVDLIAREPIVLREGIPYDSFVVNHRLVWFDLYPEECYEAYECDRVYACQKEIKTLDLRTNEQDSLGFYDYRTYFAAASTSLLVLSRSFHSCDVKWHSGPLQVIDFDSDEYRIISSSSVSPGPYIGVLDVFKRTVAYRIDYEPAALNQTRILRIEPYQVVETLMDTSEIEVKGLADSTVVLYAPRNDEGSGGLVAVDLHTGHYQELAIQEQIKFATGDGMHIAWVANTGELYVSSLNLTTHRRLSLFDSPIPTLPYHFLSPIPKPTGPL